MAEVPADPEAEDALVAICLAYEQGLVATADALEHYHFYDPFCSRAFVAMHELYRRGEPRDALSVTREIMRLYPKADQEQNRNRLIRCSTNYQHHSAMDGHIKRLRDLHVRRTGMALAAQLQSSLADMGGGRRGVDRAPHGPPALTGPDGPP